MNWGVPVMATEVRRDVQCYWGPLELARMPPEAARVHANHVVVAHRLRHKAEAFSHRSGVSGGRVVVGPSR